MLILQRKLIKYSKSIAYCHTKLNYNSAILRIWFVTPYNALFYKYAYQNNYW